ncbi:MAG TPA: ABC transporter permease [Candidatus Angelobacter sp.]|nr:ABC transporter permease [Candidatus Angelobacter sp.]
MKWLKRIRSLFSRKNAADVSDEMRFHLEREIELNSVRGMSPEEARRQALIAFGGVQQAQERVRESGSGHFLATLLQDIRFGLRMLVKSPGFTFAATLTLAVGIGANAYVFSSADGLLLRPLELPELDRLMTVFTLLKGDLNREISPADFLDWKRQSKSFSSLAAFSPGRFNITGGAAPEKVTGSLVSANFFSTLSLSPMLGRAFTENEEQPGHEQVVVLSHGLWTRRFGSDPAIVGRDIQLNGRAYKVIGVVDKNANFPTVDLWTPIAWTQEMTAERKILSLEVVGRLNPGVSQSQARAEMKGIARQLAAAYPATDKDRGVEIRPLRIVVNGTLVLPMMEALALAAGLVLLIACANVAGLLIARGISRQKEMTVRAALGARRWRLVRQLLVENVLLAMLGCAAAFALAKWAVSAQLATFSPLFRRLVSGLDHLNVDARSFLFMLGVTIFCVLAFGIIPALGSTRPDLNYSLRDRLQSSSSPARHFLRNVMVTVQVALALALLAGAFLMSRGFHEIETTTQSLAPDRVLTFSLQLPASRYAGAAQQSALYDQVLAGVRALPGAGGAAAFSSMPYSNNGVYWISFRTQAQAALKPNELPGGIIQSVSPGFLTAVQVPLMSGRDFTLQDKADSQPVAIVSARLAGRFWPHESPIGKTLQVNERDVSSPWLTVVGVARDVLYDWTNQIPEFTVYRPYAQAPRAGSLFAIRAGNDPLSLLPAVRRAVAGIDPELPVSDAQTLSQVIGDSVTPLKWIGQFVEALGLLALVLAIVGVYGVMANAVSERTREIGIRIALGASRTRVLALVLRKSILLTLAGIALGWPAAIVLARMLASISYGVRDTQTVMLVICAVILFAVALLACAIPAHRASKVDPLVALRYE